MNPLISVIIPAYNHGAFVGAAVDSVLASSGVDVEIVVIDDGSTDDSRDRLEAYAGNTSIQIHHQENQGAHAALNRGLDLARGEIVFILNSDDAFDPRRLPILAGRLLQNQGASLAASWIEVMDAAGSPLGIKKAWRTLPPWPTPTSGPFLSGLGDPRLALLETNWISTSSNIAFPIALVREHHLSFAPLRYAHDWDFILSACHAGGIELVDDALVKYRVHGANTIGEGTDESQGLMRFEILWVVARHAMRLLRASSSSADEFAQLRDLLSNSAPTFGCDAVFDQLLLLRGDNDTPPPAYGALLDPDHPYRRSAIEVLGEE